MAETSEELFGASTPVQAPSGPSQQRMTRPAPAMSSQELFAPESSAELFGQQPTVDSLMETPSIIDYAKAPIKGAVSGVLGAAGSQLQGVAGWQAERPAYPAGQSPLEQAMRGEEQAFETYNQGPSGPPLPTTEHPLYQAGGAISGAGPTATPGTEFLFDVGSGFGSVGFNIASFAVSPSAALLGMFASGAGEAAERAVKAGATPEQVARASRLGNVAGATEFVDAILPTLGTPGRLAGLIGKVGSKILVGAFAEGGQEYVQQVIQNLIAKGIYKPDQDILEGATYNGIIGAIVGGAAKPVLDRSSPATTPTEAQINAAHQGLVNTLMPGAKPELDPNAPIIAPRPGQIVGSPSGTGEVPPGPKVGQTSFTPVQPELSPVEQLLQDLPKTPTEAHLRESSPFSSGADSSLAEAAPLIMTPKEKYPLRAARLEEAQVQAQATDEDVLSVKPAPLYGVYLGENGYELWSESERNVKEEKLGEYPTSSKAHEALRALVQSEKERYNVSKLTPEAAARRKELEAGIESLLRNTRQEQLERIVKGAIRVGAGPEAAGRSAVLSRIAARQAPAAWGGKSAGNIEVLGAYSPGAERTGTFPLIRVSLAHGPSVAVQTAFHESWHAIEGTLTREEINILRRDTEQWRQFVKEKNPRETLYDRAEPEEIWAEAAAFTARDKLFEKAGYISPESKTVMRHIHELLDRIRSYLQGHGFRTSADVFEAYYSGEMAQRRQGLPTDMLERWWAKEAGTTAAQIAEVAPKLNSNSSRNAAVMRSVDPQFGPVPAQIETIPIHNLVGALYSATHLAPAPVQQGLAIADNMAKRHKWGWGLDRLVDINPRFTPLLRYAERWREMGTDAKRIQDYAMNIARDWQRLGKQMENLAALVDDVSNMTYRTPREKQQGVMRHPTQQEFQALVQQHKPSAEALRIFDRLKQFFEKFLQLVTDNAVAAARRTITDPVALMNKITEIQGKQANLLSRPYFPHLRFGLHYVMVKDASGKVVHFETFERKGIRSAESIQMAAFKQANRNFPGHQVTHNILPENVAPFLGLPPTLLESIRNELSAVPNSTGQQPGLSPQQMQAIEQLQFAMTPGASFAHRFQQKDYTPGYSHDFLRSFARYAYSGARYYGRVKYAYALQQQIDESDRLAKTSSDNKVGAIANYMRDHLYHHVHATKGDFGQLKAGIFLYTFGYSVAGASLNLSQLFISHMFLASRFGGFGMGDARVSKAILRAMTQISNFQKKGNYKNHTQFEMKALNYGIETGRISETQAMQLAAMAQGDTLLGMGRTKAQRFLNKFLEWGTMPFEMVEQINRRVTFRAALELAKARPQAKGVREAMNKYADEYAQMVQSGTFTPSEAQQVVTAIHATEQTQFNYSRENRPRFMRNRLAASVLVFQTYTNNVLQLMGANMGSMFPRMMIFLLMSAGLMGLPGADDAEKIATWLGRRYFGENFSVKRQLREFITEAMGPEAADIALHGFARKGFGIPALVDMLGENPGRGLAAPMAGGDKGPGTGHSQNVPLPVLDRSKAMGMGQILPISVGNLLDPTDTNKAISDETQRASGAAWGVGFNLYKVLHDETMDWGDMKRWEKAMPRAARSVSSAWRTFEEEKVRGKGRPYSAAAVVPFDVHDMEHRAEIIAMALGYAPERVTRKWDQIMMQAEIEKRLQIEQKLAIENRFEAQKKDDPEEIDRAIMAVHRYNDALPDWAIGYKITGDTLERSFEARERERIAKESGVSVQQRNRPIDEYMRQLFPDAIDVQRR